MMKNGAGHIGWRIALSLAALAGALSVSTVISASAQSVADAASVSQSVCPPTPPDDPNLADIRDNQIDPEGAPKFKAVLAKLLTKGPALMKQLQTQRDRDWPALCRYRADNARLMASGSRPETIFLGDSITENWGYADPDLFKRDRLDRGISGQFSGQIMLRFYQDVVALRPHAVHIMAGTNDLGQEGNPSFGDDDIVNNLRAMMDMAKANGIRVVVASIPPTSSFFMAPNARPAQRITRLNHRIRALAEENGAVYVDYHAVLADGAGGMRAELTSDGVHPNRLAYALMRPLAEKALADALR